MKRVLMLSAMLLGACAGEVDQGPAGEATATITQVPSGVGCIQLQVVGSRTVTKNVGVMAGVTSVVSLANLPVGADTFSAVAFAAPCNMIAGANPNWASDAVVAVVAAGAVTPVTLPMHGVGGANVGIDFQDDGGGAAPPDGGTPIVDLAMPPPVDLAMPPPVDLAMPPPDLACIPHPVCPSNTCGTFVSDGCGGNFFCNNCSGVCLATMCCIPEPKSMTCSGKTCGTWTNNCGQPVTCGTCVGGTCDTTTGTCSFTCDCSKLNCKLPLSCDPTSCSCA